MANDAFTNRTTETRLTSPLNGSVFTTTRQAPAGKLTPVIGDSMAEEIGAAWADSRIIEVATVPQNGKEVLTLTHARIPDEAAQLASNWETATADIGGQKYPSVQRTFIIRAEDYSEDSPAAGSAMPFVSGDEFDGKGYILTDRKVQKSGMQLEPVFKVEVRSYVRRSAITSIAIDPLNGKTLPTSSTLVYASEIVTAGLTMVQLAAAPNHAYWGMQADGSQRTWQQLSAEWYAVETTQVVGGAFVAGVVLVSDYVTNDNYSWPAVLGTLEILDWPLRSGGEHKNVAVTYNPERYDGPCKTRVVRTWSRDPFTIPAVVPMMPTRITYGCPDFAVNVPECLHNSIGIEDDKSNKDQVFKWTTGTERIFKATNHVAWPAEIISFDDQDPYRGGYLRTQCTTSAPDFAATPVPGKALAEIVLAGLTQTYDGTARTVTATTVPAGKTVVILYNWGTAVPVAAGSYDVLAYVNDTAWYGTFAAVLKVAKKTATITLGATAATYDHTPHAVTVTTVPAGLSVDVTYNGSATPPTDAGSYAVEAMITGSSNYEGYAAGTLVIAKQAVYAIYITDQIQVVTGSPLGVTVGTMPSLLAYRITYDGDAGTPTTRGDYAVIVTITDPNYSGNGTAVLSLLPADMTIGGTLAPDATGDLIACPALLNDMPEWTTDGVTCAGGYGARSAPVNALYYDGAAWNVARWTSAGAPVFAASVTTSERWPIGLAFITTTGTGSATIYETP